MAIIFDPAKDAANLAKHRVSPARTSELEMQRVVRDMRFSEVRFRAYGLLDGVPHCLAFTLRGGDLRAISLRRAHRKEYDRHVPR